MNKTLNSSSIETNITTLDSNVILNEENITLYSVYSSKHETLLVVVPITIIYSLIFITGLIGNISTCIVIYKNKTMHTATNFYLFSLSISDLLLLVTGLPQEMYSIWARYPFLFGYTFCFLRGLFSETSANATVLTITAFTIERYVAICHPFLSHTLSKPSRAIKCILCIWLTAICFAIPQALQLGVIVVNDEQIEVEICLIVKPIIKHSFEVSTFMFFIAPMSLITVLYVLIGLKLKKSSVVRKNDEDNSVYRYSRRSHKNSSGRVIKMLGKRKIPLYVSLVI